MNTNTVTRIARSSRLSGSAWKFFRMFSTKVVEGASSVAEAVDMMADSSAPKNSTCSHTGMRSITSVGRIFCVSSCASFSATSGITMKAATPMKIGTKANTR